MNESANALIERYHPREYRLTEQTSKVDFPNPGVVVLVRDNRDGSSTLVSSLFARQNAGAVATSLLRLHAAARGGHYSILIVPVERLYDASRIQLEFQAVCGADRGLANED